MVRLVEVVLEPGKRACPPLATSAIGADRLRCGRSARLRRAEALGIYTTRWDASGSVLISSNRPVEEWDEVFGDQVVAAAILDRLLHHSHVVTIRGESYWRREKRRSGLFRPQAGGSSSSGIGGAGPPTPAKEG